MCDATVIIAVVGVVIAAASTGYSLYQQSEQAAATNKYQDRLAKARDEQIEQNYALSVASANSQYRSLQDRQAQEAEAAAAKQAENARTGAQARSQALLAAGEAGVSGLSVSGLLSDFMGQEARYRDAVKTNAGYASSQLQDEMKGVHATASGRVASIQPYIRQPVDTPNYIGAALRVGGSALDAYTRYTSGLSSSGNPSSTTGGSAWQAYRSGERAVY